MTLAVSHPPGREPERAYAAHVLLGELLGLEVRTEPAGRSDVAVRVDGEPGELVFPDGLFATERWLEPASLPQAPFDDAPFLYPGDPFGSAFFLLTRYEELVSDARDEHGRFGAAHSVLAGTGLLGRPLVDELADVVWGELETRWPRLERRRGAFGVLPSHDVDWPRSPERGLGRVRRAAGDAVRGDPGQAAARLAALARGRDPNDTFDELMAVSEARGLRSAFFFIAGGTPPLDGDYSLDDPWVRRLLRRIHERGHEIGLHGSYATMTDPGMLAGELERLRRACAEEGVEQERWGGRQHFLRWRCPDTWRAWDEAGLDVDSSLGFHDDAGFRCGTSHPFPVFDLERRRELRLREQPLVAMEVALLDRGSSSPAGAGARLRALKDACRRHGGAFTLLWHNSRYVSPRERRLYREALDAA